MAYKRKKYSKRKPRRKYYAMPYARAYHNRKRRQRAFSPTQDKLALAGIVFVAGFGFVLTYAAVIKRVAATVGSFLLYGIPVIVAVVVVWFVVRTLFKYRKQATFFATQRTLKQLRAMDPIAFEHFVAWWFEQQGFKAKVTQAQGDHGIDVIVTKDKKRYGVQVKRYKEGNNVPEKDVRDLLGSSLGQRFAGGFFVTTSRFTHAAQTWAKKQSITLVDGDELVRIINTFDEPSIHAYTQSYMSDKRHKGFGLMGIIVVFALVTVGAVYVLDTSTSVSDDPELHDALDISDDRTESVGDLIDAKNETNVKLLEQQWFGETDAVEMYFHTSLQDEFIARMGRPIEGFTPAMFIQVFPGLEVIDFNKVEATQGVYVFADDELQFMPHDGPQHSAATAITEFGMNRLFFNLLARQGLIAESTDDVDVLLALLR